MSNKFLSSGGDINLSNGSQTLFGATIGAVNLNPSTPLKTNSVRELVSEKLDIGDVNNLTDDLKIKQNLSFIKNDTQTNPDTNQIKIYAKTDGNLYKRDSDGNETGLGGGGGGLNYTTGSTNEENGLIFRDGVSNTNVINITEFKYTTDGVYGPRLKVTDLETDDHFSIDTELEKINNITSATQVAPYITDFQGEIHVAKIKSASHNTEMEFETDGTMTLTSSDNINFVATNDIIMSSPAGNIVIGDVFKSQNTEINGDALLIRAVGPDTADHLQFQSNKDMRAYILNDIILNSNQQKIKLEVGASQTIDNYGALVRFYPSTITPTSDRVEIEGQNASIRFYDGVAGASSTIRASGNDLVLTAVNQIKCSQVPNHVDSLTNKNYVDTQIATISTTDLQTKTQNISLTDTDATKTRMTQPLELGPDAIFSAVQTRFLNFTTLGQNLTSGWEFETNSTYYMTKIKISKDHISNLNQVVYLNQFRESDNSIINTITFTLNQEDADYYYVDYSLTPYVLPSWQGTGTKWCISTFLSTGNKIQASLSTQPNPLLLNVYGRTNINNVSWNFPTTKGAQDFMPVIDLEFIGYYPLSSKNLKALDVNCRDINLSGKILSVKEPGNITDVYEFVTKGYADIITPLFIAATDEVNSITTTGEKMRIYSPKAYTIKKIKTSINSVAGTGFEVSISVNSVSVYSHTFGSSQLVQTSTLTNPIYIAENDPITINVLNSGGNTASGLKCYLLYN